MDDFKFSHIDKRGNKYWYSHDEINFKYLRCIEDINGDKYWYDNFAYHRIDGPAIEYVDGRKFWYLNGKKITEEEHAQLVKLKAFW